MSVTPGSLARLRKTVARHVRRGFVRAVFARPGDDPDEQVIDGEGTPLDADAIGALLERAGVAAREGRVKQTYVIDERTRLAVDARHGAGKLIELDEARIDKMTGGSKRALRPDVSGGLLRAIGIMNPDGTISAKHAKKYKQVTHFVELCRPIWEALARTRTIDEAAPLRVVDLGCGNGYLTFVVAEALRLQQLPARIVGVDVREDVIARCRERASALGWAELSFERTAIAAAGELSALLGDRPDLVIALHACDTATDDALALAIESGAPAILAAPCCQHELAAQLGARATDGLSPAIAAHGLLRQDLAATLTDALRIDVLAALGWSVDTLEFVDDSHTPKNLLLRASLRGRIRDRGALAPIRARCDALGVSPRLLARLDA
jgi:SAM-dependent methyltransferase